MSSKEVLIEVQNLKQHFKIGRSGVVKAVDDISFKIYKGETFGLVGESGSGKSTTGRTMIRLYNPTGGKVFMEGDRIDGRVPKKVVANVNRNMQMIFQDPMACLNPRMKVEDIIAEGIDIHKLAKNKEDRREKVIEMLKIVGLNEQHADRYPHEFSGGQRQRIGIARAMAVEPKFIIADEPISALDVSIQAQVVNLMNELKQKKGLTYLFIAHDLSMVKYISDRIAVMYKGKIMELTTSKQLFEKPLHPYTRSLLSAIPLPDPINERTRRRHSYVPEKEHDYSTHLPEWVEVDPGHFIYGNEKEIEKWNAMYR
ncbi:ABC transporter ATP-binding protein [Vallitalea sp.]|jgi:oligopeptide transport system ATP-binding protein|uniref:ABC transporter ATP-binding protein n=1 Tax=Vallitalea sp. TaxID=1882829 RepID=UPI0025D029D3|nr:ABC transporter ATP-binding protein [Vallitalea sp.]MCT4685873.1 ABC transporter ATP-binding protein [Vallitalea sp.]